MSYVAAIGCFGMAIPPVLIGAIAKVTGILHTQSIWLCSSFYIQALISISQLGTRHLMEWIQWKKEHKE